MMTDVLTSIQLVCSACTIAVLLIGLAILMTRLTGSSAIARLETLEYRTTVGVLVLAALIFIAEFLARGSIEGLRSITWVEALIRMLAALNLPILLIGIAVAYRAAQLGGLVNYLLKDPGPIGGQSKLEWIAWPMVGFLALSAVLLSLEYKQPYYFTQDDNLAQNLPEILQGCRSLFAGVFPTWNPYQYMGSPNTTLGWYSLTYPPTYFSYWLAKTLLGNENATLEVFAFFHLLLGYVALYWVIRREGCRPSVAMLGSSCCMISGYALIFSRSWYQFSPVLLWMALLVICVQSLARDDSGWKWILTYGAVIGAAFHAGHIQMWAYSVMLADVAILLLICIKVVPVRAMIAILSAHFLALAIAAPLLIPELLTTLSVRRFPDSRGIRPGLIGLFVPATVYPCPPPIPDWGLSQKLLGEMYYSGTLFMVLVAILLVSMLASRWTRYTVRGNIWLFCALLAFLLALGEQGLLWTGMMQLPGFSRFRFPFKFLAYVVLFVPLAGSVALERLMRNQRWTFRREILLAVIVWVILAYHSTLCTAAFYNYGFNPYPKPDSTLASKLAPFDEVSYPKVFPISGESRGQFRDHGFRSLDPHFVDSYMNQWPTLVRVFSIEGYNPLVSESPTVQRMALEVEKNSERALYEYGVEYVLQYDSPGEKIARRMRKFDGSKLVYESSTILLMQLRKPLPMSYAVESPEKALPVKFDGAGATIRTSSVAHGGSVILNMLWRGEFRASAAGKRLPINSDSWGRIALQVPPDTNEVRVSLRPQWEYGFALAGIALLFWLVTSWWFMALHNRGARTVPCCGLK